MSFRVVSNENVLMSTARLLDRVTAWPVQLLPTLSPVKVVAPAVELAVTPGNGVAVLPLPPMPMAETTR